MRALLGRLLKKRAVRSFCAGAVLTPVSFGLFMVLVHGADMEIFTASLVRGVLMTPVTFFAGRHFTWRSMRHYNSVGWQLLIHTISRPVTFGLHQGIMLASLALGVHYAWAYWIAVSLTGIFNYFWGEKVTFTPRWAQRKIARLQPAAAELAPA